jgi:hypothetical protein
VAGGGGFPCSGNLCYSTVNGSAELYDPASETWAVTGSLGQRRSGHSATLLQNGQVLVLGGYDYGYDIGFYAYINSAELYDPTTGSWQATASPMTNYVDHSATLLKNGKVLVVFAQNPPSIGISAELYDPATATWTSTDAPTDLGMMRPISNGKIFSVAGRSSELYDPDNGKWTSLGGFNVIRFPTTATVLDNGKVLVTGQAESTTNAYAELYDPALGTWTRTGNPNTVARGTATLLPNGDVLVAGGSTCSDVECHSLDSAEVYDPVSRTWSLTSHLSVPRSGHSATPLHNGRVLLAGGHEGDIFDLPKVSKSAELYNLANSSTGNQIDTAGFFVRQHYRDFLNREPDTDGLAFWTNEITSCGVDQGCSDAKRINVSAAFFLSIEFQQTGYLVYRLYKSAYGNLTGAPVPLTLGEFLPDTRKIGQGVIVNQAGWEQELENNKQTFTADFVRRSRFTSLYPTAMAPTDFVTQLFMNAGITPSANDLAATINEFGSATTTGNIAARARVLRQVAENSTLAAQEFNRAFVLMQYFGYLRRNPNDAPEPTLDFQGHNFWLLKLDSFHGDYIDAEMVRSFLVSAEYRQRFGP